MIYQYRQLAFAIINRAVYDYFYYRHKRGREEVIKRMIEKHQLKKPEVQSDEFYLWQGEMQRLNKRLWRVHDADNQLLQIEASMRYGEIATLCDLLQIGMTGEELFQGIRGQTVRPAKFMRRMDEVK